MVSLHSCNDSEHLVKENGPNSGLWFEFFHDILSFAFSNLSLLLNVIEECSWLHVLRIGAADLGTAEFFIRIRACIWIFGWVFWGFFRSWSLIDILVHLGIELHALVTNRFVQREWWVNYLYLGFLLKFSWLLLRKGFTLFNDFRLDIFISWWRSLFVDIRDKLIYSNWGRPFQWFARLFFLLWFYNLTALFSKHNQVLVLLRFVSLRWSRTCQFNFSLSKKPIFFFLSWSN